jgi:hypothetical protein
MLISLIDGESRLRIVNAKALAMRDGLATGVSLLCDDPSKSEVSRVAFLVVRSELLYLDQQFEAANKVYDTEIEPLLDKLSPECAALLADNRSTIARASLDAKGIDRFYHEVDVRRLLGVELHDSSAELEADRDAMAGKHHNALPTIWKLLLDAYRRQNWRALHWAHASMAKECLALGWPDEAVWHAVQSLDADLLKQAANHLAASRDRNRVQLAIDRLLKFSKLTRHAGLAADFFFAIADCIPDDRISQVIEWASERLDLIPTTWADSWIFEPIWKLVGRLGHRFNSDLALKLAQKAATHGAIERQTVVRKHLIDAWSRVLEGVSPEHLEQFIMPALSLVTTHKSDVDFVESINLVCHLAEKNQSCRDALRSAMFPVGVEVSNPILLEAASFLGWHPQNPEKLNGNVIEIATALRKQVEILDVTNEPSKLGGYGHVTKVLGTQKMVVHVGGVEHWVDAMAVHLESLNDNSIRLLVQSMLDMMADDRNILRNRIALTQSLGKFILRLPPDLAEKVSEILGRIARGDFKESEIGQTHKEATNPLNAFKFGFGDPSDLRGIALITLANGSKAHSTWSAQLHSGILQEFLELDNDDVRWFGVVAACAADRLSEGETMALIASTLDGSSKVRKHVLHRMSQVESIVFDRQGLRLAIRAVSRASDSSDAEERAGAARGAKALLKHVNLDDDMRTRLTTILNGLHTDISYFVRQCA